VGYDFVADDEEAGAGAVNGDCDGHGTHIAATAAGRGYTRPHLCST
jgi:subtilisin family serine protease